MTTNTPTIYQRAAAEGYHDDETLVTDAGHVNCFVADVAFFQLYRFTRTFSLREIEGFVRAHEGDAEAAAAEMAELEADTYR